MNNEELNDLRTVLNSALYQQKTKYQRLKDNYKLAKDIDMDAELIAFTEQRIYETKLEIARLLGILNSD